MNSKLHFILWRVALQSVAVCGILDPSDCDAVEAKAQEESVINLPLPKVSEDLEKGGTNPVLSLPLEGLPPLPADFKIDNIPLEEPPKNALRGWRIARLPARENRDAMAAYWTRVHRSKTSWNVSKDPKSGLAIANPSSEFFLSEETGANVPAFPLRIKEVSGVQRELKPHRIWKLSDGWLVVEDSGKGGVVWFDFEGNTSYLVAEESISHLESVGERFFTLNRARTTILELVKKEGNWSLVEFYKPTGKALLCAMAALPDSRLCLVTRDRLISVNMEKKQEILLSNPGWAAYEPNSALYDAELNRVFVGMRHFVARCSIDDGNRASVLLRPSDG